MVRNTTTAMQSEVEAALPWISPRAPSERRQCRVGAELRRSRCRGDRDCASSTTSLLAVQPGVVHGGRSSPFINPALDHDTVLAIFTVGIALTQFRPHRVGEIVMFVLVATLLIQKLEQVVSFTQQVFMEEEIAHCGCKVQGAPASDATQTRHSRTQ